METAPGRTFDCTFYHLILLMFTEGKFVESHILGMATFLKIVY